MFFTKPSLVFSVTRYNTNRAPNGAADTEMTKTQSLVNA